MRQIIERPADETFAPACFPGHAILIPLIALLLLLAGSALPAWGEGYNGEVTVGIASSDLDNPSGKAGEYTGVTDSEVFGVADAEIAWEKGLYYLLFVGRDLGFDHRSVELTSGTLGGYRFVFGYDQTPHVIDNDAVTIHNGVGSNDLTLPASFKRGSETGDMLDSLKAAQQEMELRVDRNTATAAIDYPFGPMVFSLGLTRTEQTGERELAGALGVHGGINRAVFVPAPVDWTTNDFTAALTLKGKKARGRLEYNVSAFENAYDSVKWDSPFPSVVSGQPFPDEGRTSVEPSNLAQRITLSGNAGLPYATTVTALASFGVMTQDEPLLSYSNNPDSTITTPPPRSTAKGEMSVLSYRLKVASRPIRDLRLSAGVSHYGMENQAPNETFVYIPLDSGLTQEGTDSGHALNTLPFDSQRTSFDVGAGYRIVKRTNLKVGYTRKTVERSYREVERTDEDVYKVGLNSAFDLGFVNLLYETGRREIDGEYDEAAVYENYHTHDYINTVSEGVRFDDHPLLRKYDLANRDRTKAGVQATLFAGPAVTFGLGFNQGEDLYDDSEFGLSEATHESYTIDATFDRGGPLALFAFYTGETHTAIQQGRSYRGHSKATESVDPTRDWKITHEDTAPTYGMGATLRLMGGDLTMAGHYTFSEVTTAIGFEHGESLESEELPDLSTTLAIVDLTVKYRVSKRFSAGLGFEYADFTADDWAVDDVAPMSDVMAEILSMSGAIDDYTAQMGKVFVIYRFGK